MVPSWSLGKWGASQTAPDKKGAYQLVQERKTAYLALWEGKLHSQLCERGEQAAEE